MRATIDPRRPMEQMFQSGAGEAIRRLFAAPRRNAAAALALAAMAGSVMSDRAYAAPPASNEIRIGNTAPLTGPASAYGVISKVVAAYLDKINAEGGINGRKVSMITYDDAYDPIKAMAMTRKLVEEDQVLFTMGTVGTNTNATIQPYLNSKKVPQLFTLSGAAAWDQPREFPWTMGFLPTYAAEAHIYAQYLLENHPRSRIAVLYQDDGFGKDYVKGLKDGLGGKIPIVAEAPYKVTDTNIDAQIAKLKASGAEAREAATLEHSATQAWTAGVQVAKWNAVAAMTAWFSVQIAFLVVLGLGGARVAEGAIPISTLIASMMPSRSSSSGRISPCRNSMIPRLSPSATTGKAKPAWSPSASAAAARGNSG